VGIVRDRAGLLEAGVRELWEAGGRVRLTYPGRIYNKEWIKVLERENMLDNLAGPVEAALAREEL
jgi:succinate dehydrogenase/fumarate reductase flavoprotein subunit